LILFVSNILNSFYKCTLIVSRTTNIDIYLRFRIFDAMFDYFEYLLEKTININICFSTKIVTRACNKALTKFAKYYSKIEELDNIL